MVAEVGSLASVLENHPVERVQLLAATDQVRHEEGEGRGGTVGDGLHQVDDAPQASRLAGRGGGNQLQIVVEDGEERVTDGVQETQHVGRIGLRAGEQLYP